MASNVEILRLDQWQRLCKQRAREFKEQRCRMVEAIPDKDRFRTIIDEMHQKSRIKRLPTLFRQLEPTLDNVDSFVRAISAAARSEAVACLIWGGLHAVIECACNNASSLLEDIINLCVALNNGIPSLKNQLHLFPGHADIQYHLQDLYEDYLGYCIWVVNYLRHRPSFLQSFWATTPQSKWEEVAEKITQHAQDFETEVAGLEHRHPKSGISRASDATLDIINAPMNTLREDVGVNDDSEPEFPISTVDSFRNHWFVGREEILDKTRQFLIDEATNQEDAFAEPRCVIFSGIGGVGKSQAALEYTFLHRNKYDAVFWLPAEHSNNLKAAYAGIARVLHCAEKSKSKEKNQGLDVEKVRNWLETTRRRWLIIFDNMEDVQELKRYIPSTCKGTSSIIMTTQRDSVHQILKDQKTLDIPSFDTRYGSALIFKYMERKPKNDDEKLAAEDISEFVEGLPLALAAIGGYLNHTRTQINGFLDNLKRSSYVFETLPEGPGAEYSKSLRTVFTFAIEQLPPRARAFLTILAFMDPDCVPERIFHEHFNDPLLEFARNEDDFIEDIGFLRKRQLIKRDERPDIGSYLSMHRSLQWNILLDISAVESHRWDCFRDAMKLLQLGCPIVSKLDVPEPDKMADFEMYVPQVLSVRTHCLWPVPPLHPPIDFADLLSDLATYMWHAGLSEEGLEALRTVIDVYDEEHVDSMDPRRGDVLSRLGILISFNGVSARQETLECREEAWTIRQAEYDDKVRKGEANHEDEVRLWNVKSDMAFTCLHEEQFDLLEQIMEKCKAQYQLWDSNEDKLPFEYSKYYWLTAFALLSKGDPDSAIQHSRRAVELMEKAATIQHPMTQLWKFGYAMIVYHVGEVQKAWELHEDIRTDRIKICGEFNHFTLESHSTCAYLLGKLDRHAEAEPLFKKCLERRKRTHWNREGVARAQYRYSKTLAKLGKPDEAQVAAKAATRERLLFMKDYPDRLKDDPDEEVIFDQMVSMWAGRMTGKLVPRSTSSG